ncbi:MAG: hypothetical protein AAF700_11830 [Pseudomonadota bacterium]
MQEETVEGGFFSRNYLAKDTPSADDKKMRHRIAKYLETYTHSESGDFGRFIETELGISVLSEGPYSQYVNWMRVLEKCSISDFLDIVTAVCRLRPSTTKREGRMTVKYDFLEFAERVFREQAVAYRIDQKGGIHPFIDKSFSSTLAETLEGLEGKELFAAKAHLEKAEKALLEFDVDTRQAVRSAFDAVENLAKIIVPKSTQLNKDVAQNGLRPKLCDPEQAPKTDFHPTTKLFDGFIQWINAAHFYRHDPGQAEPTAPSKEFAVLFLSQGVSYARWLSQEISRSQKQE